MKLWTKIKIKNKIWKAVFQKNINDDGPCAGLCDYGTKTLKIVARDKVDRVGKIILIHELLHALGAAYEFNLRDSDRGHNETQIDRLAIALYFFNRDNPHFWEKMRRER